MNATDEAIIRDQHCRRVPEQEMTAEKLQDLYGLAWFDYVDYLPERSQ